MRAIAETSIPSAARAQAHATRRAVLGGRLADERDDLGTLDRAQVVDDPLGEGLLRPGRGEVRPLEVGDDQAPALVDARPLEGAGEQLDLGEGDVLVDVLEDLVHVRARLDEFAASRRAFGVVFVYWNRPVSVTSAM